MSLLPGLESELLGAARRTSPSAAVAAPVPARRRGGHRRRLGLFTVVGVLACSGGAYAARGLWQPVLGNEETGRAVATSQQLPQRQAGLLRVLRRPQTDVDRGAASSAALRAFSPDDGAIRLGAVRQLTTLPNGAVAVLIPVDQQRRNPVTPYRDGDDAQLCLAIVPTRGEMQPPTCGPSSSVLVGEGLTTETWDPLTPQQERDRAAAIRRAQRAGRLPKSGRVTEAVGREISRATYASRPKGDSWSVSVVPDVVRRVRFFTEPGKPEQDVTGNVVVRRIPAGSMASSTTWLDAEGRSLNADGVRVEPSALVP